MKVSLYMGMSLDGFVARQDDRLDFLGAGPDGGPVAELFGEFLASVDAIVMGRRTFEVVRAFGPDQWPYGDTRLVVLSRSWTALPSGCRPSVELGAGDPAEVLQGLGAQGVRHVYADGARTAREWLAAGLVTNLVATFVPVLLGRGLTPWGPLPADLRLELVDHRILGGQAVQLQYRALGRPEPLPA